MKEEISIISTSEQEQNELLRAVRSWRLPYWDWAMKKPTPQNPNEQNYDVPLVVRDKFYEVRLANGRKYEPVPNAFYQFTMPSGLRMGDEKLKSQDPLKDLRITALVTPDFKIPVCLRTTRFGKSTNYIEFDLCKATSRHPTKDDLQENWEKGKQDNDAIMNVLRDYTPEVQDSSRQGNLTASLRDAFYRVVMIKEFEDFATKRLPNHRASDPDSKKQTSFASCENLHDNMHGWCGGDQLATDKQDVQLLGHMSHVPVAAFDPIFWVHHWYAIL